MENGPTAANCRKVKVLCEWPRLGRRIAAIEVQWEEVDVVWMDFLERKWAQAKEPGSAGPPRGPRTQLFILSRVG